MTLQITQHINNKHLLISIQNYIKFKVFTRSNIYQYGPKLLQLTLAVIKL